MLRLTSAANCADCARHNGEEREKLRGRQDSLGVVTGRKQHNGIRMGAERQLGKPEEKGAREGKGEQGKGKMLTRRKAWDKS